MNVILSPQFEELVREHAASGRYHNEREVVEEALVALAERDRLEELRGHRHRRGGDRAGQSRPLYPQLFAEIRQQAKEQA
jgi:putative addiction module CopG family antidote